ncbi:conserved hypothetical protein [Hyphomicrobiales bacterium]|nr:conserved hypothetical protein [Hyphomicrobiales bacterium]CAH1702935.1 conserved hypothetical protein [Hyphomicrobiales bacterium]CAI0347120.1 conserved hypothetical protein [Hyphomicrobiales bacterium]
MSTSQIIEHVAGQRLTIIEADGLPAVFSVSGADGQWAVVKNKAGAEQNVFSGRSEAEAGKTLDGIATFHGGSAAPQSTESAQPTVSIAQPLKASRFPLKASTVLPWAAVLMLGGVLIADRVMPRQPAAIAVATAPEVMTQASEPLQQLPTTIARVKTPAPAIPPLPGQPAAATAPEKPTEPAKAAADGKVDTQTIVDSARKLVAEKGAEGASGEMQQLQAVLDLLNSNEKLTPELIRNVPHDLAQKLKEAGVVASPEEAAAAAKARGQKELRIVRLDSLTLDRMRDKDGVSTVPEAGTWALTNNSVVIPLPGGGDIRRPDDLKTFHLEP